ncbi:hypothetical protein B0T14DRAFT_559239 [Immersiella caudata]|uniref:Uncharacterized protein n=1 Tax=Immersiella caudata TaxID=314043 RepID=A0AA40CAU9_9PEZI|nr:hypothetical protein B0T14DRAFT_559239 [Immersiella caudata]
MPDAGGLYRCPVCFKGYKRREHLQRHRSTHTSERPHRCIVCNASFQRTDVLKRHLQTCDGTSTISSTRRRACDRCVRQKKACNSLQPCQNCEKRAVRCEYFIASSVAAASSSSSSSAQPWDPLGKLRAADFNGGLTPHFDYRDVELGSIASSTPESHHQFPLVNNPTAEDVWFDIEYNHDPALAQVSSSEDTDLLPVPEYRGYSFEFLYDFTSRTGLVSSFECATLERRQQIVAAFDHAYISNLEHFIPTPLQYDPAADDHSMSGQYGDHGDVVQPVIPGTSWLSSPIVAKLQDIVLQIKRVVTFRPNNSVVDLTWTPALEQKCIEFFSPYKFAKFMELYWSVWHPNVSIIHRPTFDQSSSKSALLAAMALLGACVSPDSQDNLDARLWFNCVEEMVFTDADFRSDTESADETDLSSTMLPISPKLQALQAAYVICLYQNWEGADASKRRIRRHRFSTVVSVARDMGIGNARHLDYNREIEFHWDEYVIREELIRTFIWIFLLDTAFVIFNNLPHRMVIKEMRMHMASPEACFQAVSAQECFQEIHALMPPSSPFCSIHLRDAIEGFCAETLSAETQQRFSQLGALNLFTIVSAFHYMIFQHQNSLGVAGQLVPIRSGLRNWIAVWEQYFDSWSASYPQDASLPLETMWKRMGFIRFAPEYWLLGVLLTNRISGATNQSQDKAHDVDDASRSSLPVPVAAGSSAQINSVDPILEKYDQTSMRQVNDLIADFRKFHVE